MTNDKYITLAHGSGGTKSHKLVQEVFLDYFSSPYLKSLPDSAIVEIQRAHLAYTTDSYVVKPIFFPGGDIGKLAICGTVNDIAVSGARPLYITCGFIIEEGFEIETLRKIASSMALMSQKIGVQIVAGDTKVVEKGACDGVFINTSGIGEVFASKPMNPKRIEIGDSIIINGAIADHGMAIMCAREELHIDSTIESDCGSLSTLTEHLVAAVPETRFMRDATRGGLATILCETCENRNFGISIDEAKIPVNDNTNVACEMLGIDPLYVANEGKLVAFVPRDKEELALATLQNLDMGNGSCVIGRVTENNSGRVTLKTDIGSERVVSMLSGDQLPRIC